MTDNNANVAFALQRAPSTQSATAAWLAHHQFSARQSLKKFFAEPLSSAMICLVIGIALALPMGLWLVIHNIQIMSADWDAHPQVSVYVRQSASSASTEALAGRLKNVPGVKSIRYISPDAGLKEFMQSSNLAGVGMDDLLKSLGANPLPSVYVVAPDTGEESALEMLAASLRSIPDVEYVQIDLAWAKKLQQITVFAERFVLLVGGLLCLGIVLAVGNTIRLVIESRHAEIVVVTLVGGTHGFVRRPLLYTGLWYGLFGGLVGCALVGLAAYFLWEPSRQLFSLYLRDTSPEGFGFLPAMQLVLLSASLGLMGSWLATTRYLYQLKLN